MKTTNKTIIAMALLTIAFTLSSCQPTRNTPGNEIGYINKHRSNPDAAISEGEADHYTRQRNQVRDERDLEHERKRDRNYNVRDTLYTVREMKRTFGRVFR